MRLTPSIKVRSVKLCKFTMKLVFALSLILHVVHGSISSLLQKYGFNTPKRMQDARLKQLYSGDDVHRPPQRWLKGGIYGRMQGIDHSENCPGATCMDLSDDETVPEISRTKLCYPSSKDKEWKEIFDTFFKCYYNPEMRIAMEWKTQVLTQASKKLQALARERMPNLIETSTHVFNTCALEELILHPLQEIPRLFDCVGFGKEDVMAIERRVENWLRLDMPLKKRVLQVETAPCFMNAIKVVGVLAFEYYRPKAIKPPAVERDPETGVSTLKQNFGPLLKGDKILIDFRRMKTPDQVASTLMEIDDVSKDPKYVGFSMHPEAVYIYCAVEKIVNFGRPEVQSSNKPGANLPQLHRTDARMVPINDKRWPVFRATDDLELAESSLKSWYRKERREIKPKSESSKYENSDEEGLGEEFPPEKVEETNEEEEEETSEEEEGEEEATKEAAETAEEAAEEEEPEEDDSDEEED